MWRNFITAIGLLSIAMLSALYSSSVAREGRMIPAAVSAIAALAIAVWVGIKFVPRLAANVEWDWLPFLSHYHVTREGWIYFGAILIVVFASINTNNNLLYMVLSALLAVLLMSGFLSGANFRSLNVELRLPRNCFSGEPFPISIQVQNHKTIFPSFSLMVENAREGGFLFGSFYVTCIRAQEQSFHSSEALLRKRGRYSIKNVKIFSRYPFGFFLKSREYPVSAECTCYPEIVPREQMDRAAIDTLGSNQRFERGLGNDLYMIRDYLPSDTVRHVHWKASAKTAALKTREFAAEESRRVAIQMDRFCHILAPDQFEKLVSYAASLFLDLIRDGIEVELVTDEWKSGYGTSETHIESVLEYLALVQPSSDAAMPDADSSQESVMLSLRGSEA